MNRSEDFSEESPPLLARSASGLRHLRWAREILGTLQAFACLEGHLSAVQKAALDAEIEHATALVAALSAAVKPYRDFLERSRTRSRGRLRSAAHLVTGGSGLAAPPDADAAARLRDAAEAALLGEIEPQRQALRFTLAQAVDATRVGFREMNERLIPAFSARFVAALYPALSADGTRVLDDGDPDDDAAAAS